MLIEHPPAQSERAESTKIPDTRNRPCSTSGRNPLEATPKTAAHRAADSKDVGDADERFGGGSNIDPQIRWLGACLGEDSGYMRGHERGDPVMPTRSVSRLFGGRISSGRQDHNGERSLDR
jgi:hypothetical protein